VLTPELQVHLKELVDEKQDEYGYQVLGVGKVGREPPEPKTPVEWVWPTRKPEAQALLTWIAHQPVLALATSLQQVNLNCLSNKKFIRSIARIRLAKVCEQVHLSLCKVTHWWVGVELPYFQTKMVQYNC
jgi:hypothetical protein